MTRPIRIQHPIRTSGLMRCCLLTIKEYDGICVPGTTVIKCRFHIEGHTLIRLASDGTWERDRVHADLP